MAVYCHWAILHIVAEYFHTIDSQMKLRELTLRHSTLSYMVCIGHTAQYKKRQPNCLFRCPRERDRTHAFYMHDMSTRYKDPVRGRLPAKAVVNTHLKEYNVLSES